MYEFVAIYYITQCCQQAHHQNFMAEDYVDEDYVEKYSFLLLGYENNYVSTYIYDLNKIVHLSFSIFAPIFMHVSSNSFVN